MLDTLKAWLNGTREYYTGAAIYKVLGKDDKLKALFEQGYTLYNNFRLQEELKAICKQLKAEKNAITKISKPSNPAKETPPAIAPGLRDTNAGGNNGHGEQPPNEIAGIITQIEAGLDRIGKTINTINPELYTACKLEADKKYKEAMNKRAVLFSMVPANEFELPNRPDLVESRKDLALDVVKLHREASELYDKADFVKIHGKLPDAVDDTTADEVAALADHEVKAALDNARKAYNKHKGKEMTADRVALMQKHEEKIKKLEERWLCLKQKNKL